MEMPLNLQTLPAEALDILRYYGATGAGSAHADDITDGTSLTDRGFGKGIRRLVTRNYLSMAGEQVYRLTEQGKKAVAALQEYEQSMPPEGEDLPVEPRFVQRRLVVAAPKRLLATQPTTITVGIDDAQGEDLLPVPVTLHVRLSVLNGEPRTGREHTVVLSNRYASQAFEITPGEYTRVRVRVEVFQEQPDEQFESIGGVYVDLPVTGEPEEADHGVQAFGADLYVREYVFSDDE
ncbi:MAG: hypothetical protein IAE80_12910 [Anaerolinea sp.]|nr:hypothetical protein [Anaerolinea sp.]